MKKQSKVKTVLRLLLIAAVSVIVGWSAYSMNASKVLGNAMPMPFGVGVAVVESGSMEPTLGVGDVIVVREAENFDVGDVVVFQSGHSLVVHRIIEKNDAEIITQGDANNTSDAPITVEDICGVLKFHIPKLGFVLDFIRTPVGILLMLGAAFVLLEASFRREKQSANESRQELLEEILRLRAELEEENQNESK